MNAIETLKADYAHFGVAPSILSADFLHMADDVQMIEDAGARVIHVDVMDGHFVPNLTMGIPLIKQLKPFARIPLDVHLMIDNPLVELPWFLRAGSDIVTIHAETLDAHDTLCAIDLIHEQGAAAGVSIKPHTPVDVLKPYLAQLDQVLVMSVEPGFSGQGYIEGSEQRVADVRAMARECGRHQLCIEVDGGINRDTVALVARAGANRVVCGSAVFGARDVSAELREIERRGAAVYGVPAGGAWQ